MLLELIVIYVIIMFGSVCVYNGIHDWRVKSETGKIVFRKPLSGQIAGISLALPMLCFPFYMTQQALTGQVTGLSSSLPENLVIGFLGYAISFLPAIVLLWVLRPESLIFDVQQRTYCHRIGWPFITKVTRGNFEDIEGVGWKLITGRGEQFRTKINWKERSRKAAFIGIFNTEKEAQAQVDEVANQLEIPTFKEAGSSR